MESINLQNNAVFLTKAPPTVNLYSIGYTTAIQITHPYGQNCKITHGHAWIQNQNLPKIVSGDLGKQQH